GVAPRHPRRHDRRRGRRRRRRPRGRGGAASTGEAGVMTRRVWVGIAVTGAALAGWWVLGRMTAVEAAIETAEVTRGEFVERLLVRGEVQAQRSVLLTAPSDAGELRIVELAANGTPVKAGDVVIGFDPTSLTTRLQEKSSALREAEAEIARAFAEGRITLEEYTTALLTAQYDVER